ncbi:MAG: hypothetical protein H6696_14825 [Deferribacteres bacterium]|nr:hypothetical protein [candidate division KSB1 bacterium]MCB9503202.1 hypothetical protein [Deferribacteres bacterium]
MNLAISLDAELSSTVVQQPTRRNRNLLRMQSELAKLLIQIYNNVERRISSSDTPMDENGLPIVPGISWNANSPNAGTLEDINPFGNIDNWHAISRQARCSRERPSQREDDHPPNSSPNPAPSLQPNPHRRFRRGDVTIPEVSEPALDPRITTTIQGIFAMLGELILAEVMGMAGAVMTLIDLYVALSEADEAQRVYSQILGMELGIHALQLQATHCPRQVNTAILEGLVRNDTALSRLWNRQVEFAWTSGPELVNQSIRNGLSKIARTINRALTGAEREHLRLLRERLPEQQVRSVFQQQTAQVRQRVCRDIANQAMEQLGPVFAQMRNQRR